MSDEICLDMDGFRGKFYVRELGVKSLTRDDIEESTTFDLTKSRETPRDWKQIDFCKHKLHGPEDHEIGHYYHLLKWNMRYYYDQNKIPGKKEVVGYKGGCVERDLLASMNIPSRNLEDFGCPRYDQLPRPIVDDCGYHRSIGEPRCPCRNHGPMPNG